MRKTWNWKFAIKAAKVVYGVLLGLVFIIMPVELWGALTTPQDYRFGGEGPAAAMWAYQSQTHYLVWCTALWLATGMALAVLLAKQASRRTRYLWSMPFLLLWVLAVFDGSRLQ